MFARLTPAAPVPADGLLHPVALMALATLLINDHVLKVYVPSPVTGLLSGFAGIVIFPLVLEAAWETLRAACSRWSGPRVSSISVACVATGIAYAAVELLAPAAELYRYGLGSVQWTPAAVLALFASEPLPPLVPVLAIPDPWDLLALPALVIPWRLGWMRARSL